MLIERYRKKNGVDSRKNTKNRRRKEEEGKGAWKPKKDEFWKKLNKDIEKEAGEKFKNIICQVENEANHGKKGTVFNIGEDRKNRYDARDSKTMLDEVCDEEIRYLDTGRNMDIDRCFDATFENSCDIKLNLLAEKLTDLIKKEGFVAQKYLSEYTEDGGWEDIKGPSFTWHRFGIKINW